MILKRLKTENEVSESRIFVDYQLNDDWKCRLYFYVSSHHHFIIDFSKICGKIIVNVIKLRKFKSAVKCFKIKQIRVDNMQILCKNTLKHLDLGKRFFI